MWGYSCSLGFEVPSVGGSSLPRRQRRATIQIMQTLDKRSTLTATHICTCAIYTSSVLKSVVLRAGSRLCLRHWKQKASFFFSYSHSCSENRNQTICSYCLQFLPWMVLFIFTIICWLHEPPHMWLLARVVPTQRRQEIFSVFSQFCLNSQPPELRETSVFFPLNSPAASQRISISWCFHLLICAVNHQLMLFLQSKGYF